LRQAEPGSQIENQSAAEVVSALGAYAGIAPSAQRMRWPDERVLLQCRPPRPLRAAATSLARRSKAPKGVPIGAQAGPARERRAVVLGAGHGEAVAEPVELRGIDPIAAKTAFSTKQKQNKNQNMVRRAEAVRHSMPPPITSGVARCRHHQSHSSSSRRAMRNGSLAHTLSGRRPGKLMGLWSRPIDVHKNHFNLFRPPPASPL